MSVYFTDSDCEIWYTDIDEFGINFLPMPYLIEGKEFAYDMGRNTDFHTLYEKMRGGAMPTTAALNPQDYIDALSRFLRAAKTFCMCIFQANFRVRLTI